ncbi:hypothetical protein K431DRAFT_61912 [Polychaeton citri CBS 116435]|uniref:Uncharacterized protein n=1 Tax=Polychaeton citri CBS 116435 TaxID=1314669 RepID=A0A9P4UQW1_9PEZI|nr:hypothetical protein K431DRAFT_61912 [Polychaeton citri CBS 116435]
MASAHRQSVLCSDTSPSQTSSHPRLRSPAEHQPSHYDDSSPLPLDRRCCSSSSSSLSSSPSLYATFKIFQLVSSFCRRVKTRVSNQRYQGPPKKEGARLLQDDFCQEFERQAFDEIDKYLGRKTYRPHRKTIASGTITDAADCIDESSVAKEVRRLLTSVNQAFCPGQPKLNSLAKSNKLFLRRGPSFRLKRLSLKQLQRLLVTVANLLQTIRCASPTRSPTNSREAGDPDIDTTYTANLEHLLLCLRDQVLRLLVAKLVQIVEEHISECQKDQGKHEDNWFFEFPDARHPLSTTWPWSIRPSLAVLWGVCWMFYDFTNESDHICFVHEGQYYCLDEQGNMINAQGGLVVPAHQVQLFRQGMQQRQLREQQDAILSLGSNNNSNNNRISGYTGGQQRQQARARQPMMPASSAQRGTPGVPSTGGQGGRALAPGTAPQLAGTGEGFSRHGRPVAASPQSGRGGAQDLKLEMMQSASTRTNNNSNGGNNNNNTSSTSSAYHPAGASASAAPSQAAYSAPAPAPRHVPSPPACFATSHPHSRCPPKSPDPNARHKSLPSAWWPEHRL